MRHDNKVKIITSIGLLNIGLLVTGVIVGCVSWFSITNKFNPDNLKSSVITEYFDSRDIDNPADGTLDNPFVITKPIHLYNLIGLQKSDKIFTIAGRETKFYEAGAYFEFGKDFDGDGDHEFHYYTDDGEYVDGEYTKTLNMSYYQGANALSPIGTASRPFTGHIEGHNKTVQNLHIDGTGCADIGIFGYTSRDSSVSNLYFEGIDIDARNGNPDEVNPIYHTQEHSFVNVGYIAGHVESNKSFTHVYVNNCKIRNSQPNNEVHNNDYGYFGYAEGNSNPVANGEGFQYELNPNNLYSYLDTNYGSIKGNGLVLRGDYSGKGTGTVSNAITHSTSGGDHYTITGKNEANPSAPHTYAWNSIGYEEGDSVNNVWYKEGESYHSFPTSSSVVEDEPMMAGDYLYYNGTQWDYYRNTASAHMANGVFAATYIFFMEKKINLNQDIWVWMNDNSYVKRYLHRTAGRNGQPDTTTLTTGQGSGQYFALVDRPGLDTNKQCSFVIPGTNDIRSDTCMDLYIMDHMPGSGNRVKYMYVQKGTGALVWGEYAEASDSSKSLACKFTVTSCLGGAIYFKVGNVKYTLGYQNGALKGAPITDINSVYFVMMGGWSNRDYGGQKKSDSWTLCTKASDINTTSDYTLVYADRAARLTSGPVDVIAKKQSANYRKGVPNECENNSFCDNPDIASFKMVRNSDNSYSFLDNDNGGGYLSAHSSVYDSLRVGPIYEPNSHFNVSFSNNQVELTARGDASHNKLRYDEEEARFTCVEDGGAKLYLFKRVKNGFTNLFINQGSNQGCYANYAGVETTTLPVYYSQPGQSVYTRLTDDPDYLGEFNFEAEGYESTTTVEMASSSSGSGTQDGWVRCMERGDLEDGGIYVIATYTYDHCATAGPLVNGGLTSLSGSAFAGNGKVITDLDAGALQFTLRGSKETGWRFIVDGEELGATGYDNLTIGNQGAENRWNISFAGNFFATVENFNDTECGKISFNPDETNPRFTTMMFGKEILLYKKSNEQADVTYIADEIVPTDPYYNSSVIDPLGGTSIYSNYIEMDAGYDIKSVYWHDQPENASTHGKTGDEFFSMYSGNDVIAVRVPNTGSLDFGTLIVEGEGGDPILVKGESPEEAAAAKAIRFDDKTIMCYNTSGVLNKFRYALSLNNYNIRSVTYCGLDEDGQIVASYDTTGGQMTPDESIAGDIDTSLIKEFVIFIGAADPSLKTRITKVTYKFNAAQGNMINFGLVGYRSPTYGDYDYEGDLVTMASQVTGPVMNFEYSIPAEGGYVFVSVEYSKDPIYDKFVYSITFRCSATTHIIIFNYDAQRELVKLNGVLLEGAYNDITVPGTLPPETGGWLK